MPIKRTRLSREEQARHLERVQELQAAGLDCEFPNELRENSRDLDILVAPFEGNILCELPLGAAAYAIWTRLTALRSNLRVEDCRIVSDWDLESIVLCQNQRGLYLVGQAISFSEEEVLNRRIENGLCFHHRGDIAEGWVVASSYTPIPEKYRDRTVTKLGLTFTDQFGHDYSAHAEAALQRRSYVKNSVSRVPKSSGRLTPGIPRIKYAQAHLNNLRGVGEPSINHGDSMTTDLYRKRGCGRSLRNDSGVRVLG